MPLHPSGKYRAGVMESREQEMIGGGSSIGTWVVFCGS